MFTILKRKFIIKFVNYSDKNIRRTKRIEYNYIFLDESGKPEIYSSKGINLVDKGVASKYLVIAAIRTKNQLELQQKVTDFKSKLLHDEHLTSIFSPAYSLDQFHANKDYPEVRKRFYALINKLNILIDVIVIEKLKVRPGLRENPGRIYGLMAGQLLKDLCHQGKVTEVIFSRKDSKLKLRQELEVEVERVRIGYMKNHPNLNTEINISYEHNPSYSHAGLQIADYVSYAVFQVFENNDRQYFDLISSRVGRVQDIFNKNMFTRSNPL